jgi:hypothetical protein
MPDQMTPPPTAEAQSTNPTGSVLDTGTYEAINFADSYGQIKDALDYIGDTRQDFERDGTQEWITTLVDLLNGTLKKIRDLEIKNAENMVERRAEDGSVTEVMVRDADAAGFDDLMTDYKRANDLFSDYFNKHVALIQQRG